MNGFGKLTTGRMSIYLVPLMAVCLTGCTSATERKSTVTRHKSATGLEHEVMHEGSGEVSKAGQTVSVHYTGWLQTPDGKQGQKFDSSVDRGKPFSFKLGAGQVIKGWDEGVAGMKVGEKRHLIIPAHLGYGSRGAGGMIPGGATLIFDVELLKTN